VARCSRHGTSSGGCLSATRSNHEWSQDDVDARAAPGGQSEPDAEHLDNMLDEALRETFPASDPIAITIDKPLKSIASDSEEPQAAGVVTLVGDRVAAALAKSFLGPERWDVLDVNHSELAKEEQPSWVVPRTRRAVL
jgi:hypothetical protein